MSERPTIVIEVRRWHPDAEQPPWWQAFELPYREDQSLLEALQHIKDELDGSLTFRWSCRMAICGSCGCMVDGRPELSCHLLMGDLAPGPVRVEPLAHFPVIRDLVIDQQDVLDKLPVAGAYLVPGDDTPATEPSRQTPAQVAEYAQFAQCINCLLCYSACPQYGLKPDFLGPAALALMARHDTDSRDAGQAERREARDATSGVWDCTLVGHCTEVCPQGVDPARAINRNKGASARDYLLDLLLPGRRR